MNDENKSIMRIVFEILQQGNPQLILENSEMFIELERKQLELSYMSAIANDFKSFDEYYIKTYLKEFVHLFLPNEN